MATAIKYKTTSWEAPGSFAGANTDATVRSADWGQAPVGAYGTRAGVKYRLPDRNEGVNLNPDKGRDWDRDNTVLAAGNSRTGYSTGVQGQGGAGQPTATQRARQQSGASNVTAAQTSAATGGSGAGSGGASNSPWQPPAATTGAGAGFAASSGLTPYEDWVNSQSPGGGRATATDIRTMSHMSHEPQRNNDLEAERARSAALQELQDNMPIAIGPDGRAITRRSVREQEQERRRVQEEQAAEQAAIEDYRRRMTSYYNRLIQRYTHTGRAEDYVWLLAYREALLALSNPESLRAAYLRDNNPNVDPQLRDAAEEAERLRKLYGL